jgi:hypothetical protein
MLIQNAAPISDRYAATNTAYLIFLFLDIELDINEIDLLLYCLLVLELMHRLRL